MNPPLSPTPPLPDELILHVMIFADSPTLTNFKCSSHHFRTLCLSNDFWIQKLRHYYPGYPLSSVLDNKYRSFYITLKAVIVAMKNAESKCPEPTVIGKLVDHFEGKKLIV